MIELELKKLGWEFFPCGPNEWQWMKFDNKTKYRIAVQGDDTWKRDINYVKKLPL